MENNTDVPNVIESFFGTVNAWLYDMREERRNFILEGVIRTLSEHVDTPDKWLIVSEEEDDEEPSAFAVHTDSGVQTVDGMLLPSGYLLCAKSSLPGVRLPAVEEFIRPSEGTEEQKELKKYFVLLLTSVIMGVVEIEGRQLVGFKWPSQTSDEVGSETILAALPLMAYALALYESAGKYGEGVAEDFATLAERLGYAGEDNADDMPTLEAIAPSKHIVPNSKVTQVLREGKSALLFDRGGNPLRVDKKNTQIQFALWHDEEAALEVSEDIDAEDVNVIEAVTTLKHAGNTAITPEQIIRNMGYKPTPELVEEVHGRVLRLMSIKGRIDCTEQLKRWHITNPDTGEQYDHGELVGNLLSMTVFDGTDVKGNRDIRYKVASDPITYEHARLVHQVIEYPPELLDLAPIDEDKKEKKRVSRDQKKLERAILWYVFSLKSSKNRMSNYVTYEALFDYEGYRPGSDTARKRAIKFVHAYLRALVKAGVIYAFVPKIEQSRRHRQLGVTLVVEKPGKGKRG